MMVNAEAPGAHCALGGLRVDTGLDSNNDGALETAEIQHTAYVCSLGAADGGAVADASQRDAGADSLQDAGHDAGPADAGSDLGSSDGGGGPAVCAQASSDHVFATIGSGAVPANVQAIAPGQVWGISIGTLERWDGSSWTQVAVPFTWSTTQTGVVAGSTGNNVWVTNGGATIARWDGSSWTDVSPPSLPAGSLVTAMRVLGPNEAWIINQWLVSSNWQYAVLHWNGVSWTNIDLPAEAQPLSGLLGLWVTSPADAWVISYVSQVGAPAVPLLLHWDGSALRPHAMPPGSPANLGLKAIWASSASDVWMVGYTLSVGGALWHFDGIQWTETDIPHVTFNQVWGWCASNVWALAYTGIWHYDGTSWSQVRMINFDSVAVSGTGSDDVWASGSGTTNGNVVLRWESAALGTCGDGVVEAGEQCDPPDGTTCDQQCQSIPIVCGNGIVQPGETCEIPGAYLCQNCQLTTCGQCFYASGFPGAPDGGTACSGLDLADTRNCEALVSCMAPGLASCEFRGNGPLGCYCTDATCSQGANGPCASQVQALAHSQDPAVVIPQVSNSQTPVGHVFSVMYQFGHSSCGRSCTGG